MEKHSSKSTLGGALLISVLSVIVSSTTTTIAARVAGGSTNTEFIRTSCSATSYPSLCYSSLSSHAALIQQNHKLLAHTALSVSLDTTRSTSAAMLKLSRSSSAMRDCLDMLTDSVDQLKKSMEEMNQINGANFGTTMSDVQTWVSAALTDEDTCMDGFAGNGGLKAAVRGKIVNVAHMTSNALALINSYASLHA